MADPRSFAIVPAAGLSARMGAAKLLLPFNGRTIIERALSAWLASDVDRVVVVVRADDAPMLACCRAADVEVVAIDEPRDMKASVKAGLHRLRDLHSPAADQPWLLAPADLPRLSTAAINTVLAAHDSANPAALAPVFDGRRGHPTLLPWAMAEQIDRLPDDRGINSLLKRAPVREVAWHDDSILRDVDTPHDYAAALTHDSSGELSRG